MIQLYQKGQTDFSANGIELHPTENEVNWQDGGRYDFSMTIPREAAEGITFDYGQMLKVSVPPQHIGPISLGAVSYYETTAETPLYSQIPKSVAVSYNNWEALRSYMAGDKVTYDKKNWRCVTGHGGLSVPPPNGGLWTQIAGSRMDGGKIIATLPAGTSIMKVRDFNSTYMEAATLNGLQGYIKISECTATGESGERTVPAFDISEQYFTINYIDKETDAHSIRIEAEHISYQLGRTILGECNVVGVSPATALLFITGAMQEEYQGGLYCGIDSGVIDADWSWKNAQSAILDPQNGLLKAIAARAIRDNQDVYIVPNTEEDPTYEVRYGVNMKSVKWTGDVNGIVTRIYPIAQREDGSRLMLPEKHIDSVREVPYVRPEVLDTKLKIGQKVTNSDGTEVELTEDEVITRMRQAAQDRFSIDRCDMAEITLELDWVHMPDTEEYKQYISLINAAPNEWVRVDDGPMGVNTVVQLTSYVWDAIMLRYKKTGFGDKKQKPSIAGYDIKSGAVTNRALAAGSVGSENIVAGAISAREIEAGSITAEQIASKIITAELIQAEAITADEIAAQAITTEKLRAGAVTADKIGANAITAGKIAAGAIETEKLAAYAITSAKIAAGAITTDKLDAGAVTADKISTTDLNAINAKLGTAEIANAQIATADINFAHIKDLNAQSAFFGQTIFNEAVGGKLYVPRLNVGYAQMVGATIGDLVIQASDGNFYGIDVDMAGNVTATQRTVSAGEIAAGHTSDGRTLVLGTDILATDLTTENIYASHALMNEITAAVIDVDELWARQAFIGKLMTTDITSNTYIRATIGDWTGSSTITQTINGLNTKISELGYGTVYFQPNAPDPGNLTEGDIWVKSSNVADWNDLYSRQEEGQYVYADWQAVYNAFDDWQTLCAVDRMFVWTGVEWKEMYDAQLPNTLETEIIQLASEITLKASRTEVDFLADEVTEFSAQLSIQAEEIQSAVSAVNLKAASYVMQEDPRTAYTVSVGDIWIKWDGVVDWTDIYNRHDDWQAVYNKFGDWSELIGSKSYVWNGFEWVETSDRASEIEQRTLISQTKDQITLLAEASATLNDELYRTKAELQITNSSILAEVERATTAEGGKLDKTSQYQTADQIVTTATSYVNGILSSKSAIEQTATGITAYVEEYTGDNFYSIKSGIDIKAAGIEISGAKYIKIKSGGSFTVEGGNFNINTNGDVSMTGTINAAANSVIGGWTLGDTDMHAGSGSNYVSLSSSGTYAMWAGAESQTSAPFRVTKSGEVTLTKLKYLNANGTETVFNPRTGLWKLDYHTVKAYSSDSITLSNGAVINFIKASSLSVGGGAGKVSVLNAGSEVSGTSRTVVVGIDTDVETTYSGGYINFNAKAFFSATGVSSTIVSSPCVIEDKDGSGLAYDAGKNSVTVTSVTLGSWISGSQYNCSVALSSGTKSSTINCGNAINRGWDNARATVRMPSAGTSTSFTVRTPNEARTGYDTHTFTVEKATPSASGGYANVRYNNATVARVSLLDWWQDGYDTARGYVTMPSAGTSTSFTVNVPNSARTGSDSRTFTITKGTPSADGGYAAVRYNNSTVARISLDDWWDDGYEAGKADGIADYYNSSYWEKATADNNWTPKIPNSTNTAAEDWTDSGASDAFEAGKNGVTVQRVTLGSLITGTQYNCSVLLSSGITRAGTINCATAYSDARSGYTLGIFTQYSGAQLYTMGQSGPEIYTGTLYTKA